MEEDGDVLGEVCTFSVRDADVERGGRRGGRGTWKNVVAVVVADRCS